MKTALTMMVLRWVAASGLDLEAVGVLGGFLPSQTTPSISLLVRSILGHADLELAGRLLVEVDRLICLATAR
jgi:hypothetical protein